jgi:histidinol-phosphate aminotransferase
MTSPVRASLVAYDAPPTPLELARRLGVDPESIIKLDANENPYSPPQSAISAMAGVAPNRYPDPNATALKERLSQYLGCPPDSLVLGNGSDELIDLLCRSVLRDGDTVVNCPPTFGLYEIAARASGAAALSVPRTADFSLDLQALFRAVEQPDGGVVRLVFLCSPNNPTGGSLLEADLRRLLDAGPLVALDEAYAEYAGRSFVQLTAEYSNLVVLRTFSKAFGLAGLRIGYGVFPPELARELSAMKAPYNVNSVAQAAALGALHDLAWVERHVALIRAERDQLFTALGGLPGLTPLPSETNFLLVRVSGVSARDLFQALLGRGIMVRHMARPPLQDYLRITTGTPEQNDRLLEALEAILEGEAR